MPQEGSLHIILLDSKTDTYSVRFVPYQSGGGAQPHKKIRGVDCLRKYLKGLNIHGDAIENALQDLQQNATCDITHVISDG